MQFVSARPYTAILPTYFQAHPPSSESSANDSHDRGYFTASGAALHQVFAFPNGARRTPPQKAARIMSRKCAIVKNSLLGRRRSVRRELFLFRRLSSGVG